MANVGAAHRPGNLEEYKDWLRRKCGDFIEQSARNQYCVVADSMKKQFEMCKFWQRLRESLRGFDSGYRLLTGYDLMVTHDVELCVKTFDSFLDKTFRKNIIHNSRWPEPPEGGWVTPVNRWYDCMSDIVRTRLSVKYLDGVEYLVSRIKDLCSETNTGVEDHWEARDDGYYAVHVNVREKFLVPGPTWEDQELRTAVELRIATQVQELVQTLLHRYYEERRVTPVREQTGKWQWEYENDEFAAAYLGHILHYVEGMMVEIRDKSGGNMT